jgi:Zn-dependent protease with chaperone function
MNCCAFNAFFEDAIEKPSPRLHFLARLRLRDGDFVSRVLLLLVMVLWMSRSVALGDRLMRPWPGTALFLAGLALIVCFIALWSRVLARHVHIQNLNRNVKRFHISLFIARMLIPIWFGVAVFGLGWGVIATRLLGPVARWPMELPGLLVGTFPAFIAWMALWWAQFPADQALRERNLLVHIDEDLPLYAPPGFWSYFAANFRLNLLFTVVPVLLIVLVHDLAAVGLMQFTGMNVRNGEISERQQQIELLIQLASIGIVVLFAPEVLRHVLQTQRLPESPLRARLENLCRRTGLKYREILLWRTNHNMGNAAVMGLLPRVRYILLSDVLLETMNEDQIEAVFAHEIGHVKHWHMGWYVVLVVTIILLFFGPGQMLVNWLEQRQVSLPSWVDDDLLGLGGALVGVGTFFLVFGYLSRWFERQADVFAARTMQHHNDTAPAFVALSGSNGNVSNTLPARSPTYVGAKGAATFTSALHRVAVINNIPISARNFTHGSIEDRMMYLQELSADPTRTARFDRRMSTIYTSLIASFVLFGLWAVGAILRLG